MLLLTPELCRAARALLGMGQRELAVKSGISHKTLADFERGVRSPYGRTLKDLLEALEQSGVHFSEQQEGVRGPSVALKWGVEIPERKQGDGTDATSGESGLKALSWEDDVEEASEPTPEQIELREHWRANPEQWARFHESSRQVILGMMGLRRL